MFSWLFGVLSKDNMIRDRDASYGQAVTKRLAAMGIRNHPTASRSPCQNGHAERLIGSIRRECLDHIDIFGEAHLRQILAAYAGYYNGVRTHLSLDKDTPGHRPVQRLGQLATQPVLGGLHHQYWPNLVFGRHTCGKGIDSGRAHAAISHILSSACAVRAYEDLRRTVSRRDYDDRSPCHTRGASHCSFQSRISVDARDPRLAVLACKREFVWSEPS
jgi:hypothetical protein